MKTELNEIEVNGVKYVKKDSVDSYESAAKIDNMEYVIVRTYSAGVFAGYLQSKEGKEVVLRNARRLWYWSGAASLSQLSVDGVSNPTNCKFPCAVDTITLTEAIEILSVTKKAKKSIDEVIIWTE